MLQALPSLSRKNHRAIVAVPIIKLVTHPLRLQGSRLDQDRKPEHRLKFLLDYSRPKSRPSHDRSNAA
jgi:hypothetical protein